MHEIRPSYVCDMCEKSYATREEAYACEDAHIQAAKVKVSQKAQDISKSFARLTDATMNFIENLNEYYSLITVLQGDETC